MINISKNSIFKMYNCDTCSSQFNYKYNCDRHKLTCNFLHSSIQDNVKELDDRSQNIITQTDMCLLMQDMMRRIDKLEKENRSYKQLYQRKVNVIELLNTPSQLSKMDITFSVWFMKVLVPDVKNKLSVVFEQSLSDGLIDVFTTAISNTELDKLPIRVFDKKNGFYIYNITRDNENSTNTPKWIKINTEKLYSYLRRLTYYFEVAYKDWYNENIELINNNDEMIDKSALYYLKINDIRISDQTRFNRVRQKLHTLTMTEVDNFY